MRRMTKKPYRPRIPSKAEKEILASLAENMRISTSEIDAILNRHRVKRDSAALQRSYRLAVGQRLMSSLRDENGQREVLAVRSDNGGMEYIVLDGCNDANKLRAIRHKLHQSIAGLENSSGKVRSRLRFVERFKMLAHRQG